ncbi:MAG: hypothetical protein IT168_12985 [Bryobacterales bacterium]|nr:hypothetical protein [Bryobacterales bacterium]
MPLLLAAIPFAAWPQPVDDLLSAPFAKPYIRVRLSADDKSMEWNVPAQGDTSYHTLTDNQIFVAPGSVSVAYPLFNPLKVKASVSAKAAADPNAALIGTLITSILTVVSQVAPGAPDISAVLKQSEAAKNKFLALTTGGESSTPAHACANFHPEVKDLKDALYNDNFSKEEILKKIADWRKAIQDTFPESGPKALEAGNTMLKTDKIAWTESIKNANKALAAITKCAGTDPIVPTPAEKAEEPAGTRPDDPPAELEKTDPKQYVEQIVAIHKWDLAKKKSEAWEKYQLDLTLAENRRLAILVLLVNPARRIAELNAIVKFAEDISKQLTAMSADSHWRAIDHGGIANDYVLLNDAKVTRENMQNVSITLTPLDYDADSQTGAISLIPATPVDRKLTVRNYSRFAVEPGVGAVFGSFKQPKYTTGTNSAGQTIVTRLPDSTVSINPAVMLNFVCRCELGPVAPMFQIGAATSKTLPAILLGGGLRLWGLGSGHVAIGGGAMFGWIKDLQDLKEGQKVADLAAIEADLRYRSGPKRGAYFVIQYKF